jgi:diguanylate cyclase (GGDEF)-like protein
MLLLCLGVAAPLIAIGSFTLYKSYQTLRQEASRATTFQAAIAVRSLHQWTQTQLDTAGAIASLAALRGGKADATQKIFETALKAEKQWHDLALLKDGKLIAAAERGDEGVTARTSSVTLDPVTKDFIASVEKTGVAAISGYTHSPVCGEPSVLVVCPVQGKGVLLASVDIDSVLSLFRGLGDESGTVIAVVDSEKRVIARTLQNEYWQGKDFSKAKSVNAGSKSVRGSYEAVGIADPVTRAYAFDHVPTTNWLLVVGVPVSEIYGQSHDWLVLLTAIAASCVVVSVGLAFWATLHFTRTIRVLVKESLAIGHGDFSKRVNVSARDEFGLLARAFNQMASRLELNQDMKNMTDQVSESIRKSLDLDQILNTTVRELGTALGSSRCCLALVDTHCTLDTSDDELMFDYVWTDKQRGGTELANKSILITKHSVLKLILQQGSILSLDVLDDGVNTPLFENASEEQSQDWKSIRSLIACPITTNEGPLGIILVHQCDRLRVWTDYELELVEAVARQVTLAMQHARLYNRTKSMAEQEILINHIVRSVRSSLDLDTILNTVTGELLKALGVERVQIAQPRNEGPLVVTHECHAGHLDSVKGVSLYPDQLDFRVAHTPVIKSTRAANLLASTMSQFQAKTAEALNPNSTHDQLEPMIPAEMRAEVMSGRNTILGIDLDRLSNGYSTCVETEDGELVQLPPDANTVQEAPIAVITDIDMDSRAMPFRHFLDQNGSRSLIAAPLVSENRLAGLLVVHQTENTREWTPTEVRLVAAIADQVAVAIEHAHLFATVKHQAITDGLTTLYNHVYFKNRLQEDLNLAKRKGTSCSLLMVDLDKLKVINDNYGHPVGDSAIRQVASILKTILRSGDTPARYGGEEFGVILPETSLFEAALIADRICSQIRNSHVPGLGRITVSIGAASFPKQAGSVAELVERADKALYVAKNSGRDQIRIYEGEESENPQAPLALPQSADTAGSAGASNTANNAEETSSI